MTIRILAIIAANLLLAGCARQNSPVAVSASPTCRVSDQDMARIEQSMAAWHFTSRHITKIGAVDDLDAIFFDEHCTLASTDAMTGLGANGATYAARPHGELVTLPDGRDIPVGPTSFTHSQGDRTFFVMSLPSVWRATGVDPGVFGLEALMTAVLLHEGSHVVQSPTYGQRVSLLSQRHDLPEDFNDDSIQHRFRDNQEFSASVDREIELFFAAAASPSDEEGRNLARHARELMRSRRARWFAGDDAHLSEIEDLWLSLEGSGQWAGFSYLIHRNGGAVPMPDAISGFALRGGWWTQSEGLALALTLDRLGYDWRGQAFGGGAKTLTDMLDEALAGDEMRKGN